MNVLTGKGGKRMDTAVKLNVEIKNIDAATQKAAELIGALKEARTLAGELASELEKLELDV